SGTVDTGDVSVFTVSVNPSTGQYTFQLNNAFSTLQTISGSTSFGSGPTQAQELVAGGQAVAIVSGSNGVNGSTTGWGISPNNNFDPGEVMHFDFTGDNSPISVPGFSTRGDQSVSFTFSGYKSGDQISAVIHNVDGSQSIVTFDP